MPKYISLYSAQTDERYRLCLSQRGGNEGKRRAIMSRLKVLSTRKLVISGVSSPFKGVIVG